MAYPAFIAAASGAGIPLKIAEQIAYLIAAAIVCLIVHRFTRSRWLAFLLFVGLAFNPVCLGLTNLASLARRPLYKPRSVARATCHHAAFFPREEVQPAVRVALMNECRSRGGHLLDHPRGRHLDRARRHGTGLRLSSAGMATRRRSKRVRARGVRSRVAGRVWAAPAMLMFAVVVGGVAFENGKRYGV